jgi:hypothetical protein
MAVRHQQEKVSKMNFTLHEYCDMYLILGACGNQAYAAAKGLCRKVGIQHATIQKVRFRWLDERIRETGNVLPTPSLNRG